MVSLFGMPPLASPSSVFAASVFAASVFAASVFAASVFAAGPSTWTPLALAFGAGVLAVFNPCGFALLPAFVSYTLGGQVGAPGEQRTRNKGDSTAAEAPAGSGAPGASPLTMRVLQGIGVGVPLTAGFLAVFLVAGGVLALGGRALAQVFPWMGLVVGLALVGVGVWLLVPGTMLEVPLFSRLVAAIGRTFAFLRRAQGRAPREDGQDTGVGGADSSGGADSLGGSTALHSLRASWGFGLGYGLSSLGCSLPVFLLVVGSAIAAGGLAQAVQVFTAYSAGMAAVLLGIALVATSLGDVLRRSLLPLLRWVQPLSALLILAAGVYIVVYQLRTGLMFH